MNMKKYSKRQIQEAINFWQKQLNENFDPIAAFKTNASKIKDPEIKAAAQKIAEGYSTIYGILQQDPSIDSPETIADLPIDNILKMLTIAYASKTHNTKIMSYALTKQLDIWTMFDVLFR